jgi:hypothetical protein
MTEHVIRAVAFANGLYCPHAGQWLERFNPNAYGGQGYAEFTTKISKAKRFATFADAMAFWKQTSTARPLRPDGKPNRPLTALTVVVEPADWRDRP